ncbi:uncharacterized protein F5147DRAFT_760757 [Suillus discolor]|uniref:Uncharacterized protein n=1 Tax=Suillus discolor TaxID=1912936 RepID=A0A9P7F9M0_9AGAM|nr:uncharacterized protein F5147DRAFT_760757 [Suillus discolor]KAG2109372.1 hypothetical protein F5147DRAFT_760757 [Suillus discolor]
MNTTTLACDEGQFKCPTAALTVSSDEVDSYNQNSPPPSPSSLSPGLSESAATTSGSDTEEDILPLMPDSKSSYRTGCAHILPRRSPTLSHFQRQRNRGSHPYHRPSPSFEEEYLGSKLLGRPFNSDDSSESISSRVKDVYTRQIEQLSPESFRYAVHYKEAVRERKRMRMFTAAWELEETKRLCAFLQTTMVSSEMEFVAAKEESRWLLDMIVDRQKLRPLEADARHVAAAYDRDKKSLHRADAELSLLKDSIIEAGS